MIAYASQTGTLRNLRALREAGWRLLISATGRQQTNGFRYALDNGAWHAFMNGKPFDVRAFEQALARHGDGADWVTLPDEVQGGERSLDLSLRWMRRVLDSTGMALLAVQDGMRPEDVRGFLGPRVGLFVGGSTRWKLDTMAQWSELARSRECWCHVARVNSCRRIQMCALSGADSFDGSSASRYQLSLRKLDGSRRQMALGGVR